VREVSVLPSAPEAMVSALRSVLVRERGRLMGVAAPGAAARDDRPPRLRAPGRPAASG